MQDRNTAEDEARLEEERLHAESVRDQELQRQLDQELHQVEEQAQAPAEPLAPQLEAARQARDALQTEVDDIR